MSDSDQDTQATADGDRNAAPNDKICDYPDLVLVVGPDKVRIDVDSHCIRHASHVFSAMFKPPWMENAMLSNPNGPAELALPEDNARAMYHVCCVMHHRNDLIPRKMPAREVLQVAIVADKYDMCTALQYAARGWLAMEYKGDLEGSPEKKKSLRKEDDVFQEAAILFSGHLLAAAFLFEETLRFRIIGQRLMFDYWGSYACMARSSLITDIIGPEIPLLLEERRSGFKAGIYEALLKLQRNTCWQCKYGIARAKQYKTILASDCWNPVSLLKWSVSELVDEVGEAEPSEKIVQRDLSGRSQADCHHPTSFDVGDCSIDGTNDFNDRVDELKFALRLSYRSTRKAQAAAAGGKEEE
ncbi:hypothetical protein QBC39DRAFT_383863 [Podospora conica]|nr:hypothetical protein QBC39DRAFT_383863 [Schizothecium conicum]